jgi:hypothetical protein
MDENSSKDLSTRAIELLCSRVDVPNGYEFKHHRHVIQDGREVELIRFEKTSGVNNGLRGEHFSAMVDLVDDRIDGIIHIDKDFVDEDVPTEQDAQKFAFSFLNKVAPDFAERAEVRWIKPTRFISVDPPHDTPFPFIDQKSGATKLVVGMRVKLFDPETSRFGWVISAKGDRLVAFERDIGWNRFRKVRTTEQWLHDPWVANWGMSVA